MVTGMSRGPSSCRGPKTEKSGPLRQENYEDVEDGKRVPSSCRGPKTEKSGPLRQENQEDVEDGDGDE
jgi:hypothetical protein